MKPMVTTVNSDEGQPDRVATLRKLEAIEGIPIPFDSTEGNGKKEKEVEEERQHG